MTDRPGFISAAAEATPIWHDLVGQDEVVVRLSNAVAGAYPETGAAGRAMSRAMSHAWLITGPAGSGRSVAAKDFAAALQCEHQGCGQCNDCATAVSGAHPDVTIVNTEKLSIGIDEIRDLVVRSALAPSRGRCQVIIVEDADRITVQGANALLKAIEEPSPKTVWMLCAPNPDDVMVTIRSRCRRIQLVTPSDAAVAELLVRRDGIDPDAARDAARIAQGHIGRARRLATDPVERERRDRMVSIPQRLTSVGACLMVANELVEEAKVEAERVCAPLDEKETEELKSALGIGETGRSRRQSQQDQSALKALADEQKIRQKRLQRDTLDRVLTELTTWYRDVLSLQLGHDVGRVINRAHLEQLDSQSRTSSAEQSVTRIQAILDTRTQLGLNVSPLLAMEDLLVRLGSTQAGRPGH